jgi:hypothetical protein
VNGIEGRRGQLDWMRDIVLEDEYKRGIEEKAYLKISQRVVISETSR